MSGILFRRANIYTPEDKGTPLGGVSQGKVRHYENGALLCRGGLIESVGEEKAILASLSHRAVKREVDCEGLCLIPGFVDPHTHLCFAKRRESEFSRRMEGARYLEILHEGGGILSSVRDVRAATEEELFRRTLLRAKTALQLGTTTIEIKSGYGLSTESELKMLRVIDRVGRNGPLDVVPTFLGAHAVPEEYDEAPDEYVDLLIREMLPAVAGQGIANFCDVFCEEGVFSIDQSSRILQEARKRGFGLKIHADELHDTGGAGLAAKLAATTADHLTASSLENLAAMARRGVIAVLLPATVYSLRGRYPRARDMVEIGLPIAVATDCNPGSSYTESMPFVFGLSVVQMKLSVSETLVASTLNAAYAVGRGRCAGSLDRGKAADFLLLDGDGPAILAYHAGVSPVIKVYKRGDLVWEADRPA